MDVTSFLFTWVVLEGRGGVLRALVVVGEGQLPRRLEWEFDGGMWVGLGYLRVENDLGDLKKTRSGASI